MEMALDIRAARRLRPDNGRIVRHSACRHSAGGGFIFRPTSPVTHYFENIRLSPPQLNNHTAARSAAESILMKTNQPSDSIRGVNRVVPSDFLSLPPLLLAVLSLFFALPAVAGHKVEVSDPVLAQQMANQGARLLADYEGYQLYEVAEVPPSVSGRHSLEVRDEYDHIWLNAGPIDTTSAAAAALRKPRGTFAGKRMHLLQFVGPVKPAWYEALAQTGVHVVNYIPENSYLVYGDAKALAQLRANGPRGATCAVGWRVLE